MLESTLIQVYRESINNYNRDNKRDLEKELLNVMKDSESKNNQIEQNLLVSFTKIQIKW